MDDVVVGVIHVVTFVGGDDTKICHQSKLSPKREWFLVGSWMGDTDTPMVINDWFIDDRIIAATVFGEHLGLGQIIKTSLVDLDPIDNGYRGTVHWSCGCWSW